MINIIKKEQKYNKYKKPSGLTDNCLNCLDNFSKILHTAKNYHQILLFPDHPFYWPFYFCFYPPFHVWNLYLNHSY